MAKLEDLIGRTDLLQTRAVDLAKTSCVDLSSLLAPITGSIIRDFIMYGNSRPDIALGHVLPKRFAGQWQPDYKSGIDYVQREVG